ncbi:hypothetical protein PROFUN_07898 [Planoprotostelium fungivorum]|uniref:Uncharacterized protein n=1 Tax=Planoprotostelium fungivorum TaxID=1890364 RepID=A0A2P6NL34_9EUKA|nr:hypothetical protein PROFUN_07898 [Planoprotostelium fungivorum]
MRILPFFSTRYDNAKSPWILVFLTCFFEKVIPSNSSTQAVSRRGGHRHRVREETTPSWMLAHAKLATEWSQRRPLPASDPSFKREPLEQQCMGSLMFRTLDKREKTNSSKDEASEPQQTLSEQCGVHIIVGGHACSDGGPSDPLCWLLPDFTKNHHTPIIRPTRALRAVGRYPT